jgi:HPt (histidine-containing phosphotransfer) domain-containing protein
MTTQPPTAELADLAEGLGHENVRMLVRTFLRDFPQSLLELARGDRRTQHRQAHSLKSNTRLIGMHELSARLSLLEDRLAEEHGADLTPQELAALETEFAAVAAVLQEFARE